VERDSLRPHHGDVHLGRQHLLQRKPAAGQRHLDIYVVGKQWMWKLEHMEGQREINELHIPVGRAVRLTMTSEDAIHSFFVPAFRTKQDVVPGRYTTTWFTRPRRASITCSAPSIAAPTIRAWAAGSMSWSRRTTRPG
jgi:heme/copper-type cytochrome/quinol oxidase subunit 2